MNREQPYGKEWIKAEPCMARLFALMTASDVLVYRSAPDISEDLLDWFIGDVSSVIRLRLIVAQRAPNSFRRKEHLVDSDAIGSIAARCIVSTCQFNGDAVGVDQGGAPVAPAP